VRALIDPLLRTAHNWVGLALSLVLALLALSGSLLVFKTDWLRATQPGAAAAVVVDAATFGRDAEAAERVYGTERLKSVTFAGPEIGLHQVYLADGGGAYLEPGTGRVVSEWAKNERFVDWLFDLHHHLLLGKSGTTLAGWTGFAGLLLTVSGLYLWWPARRLFAPRLTPRSSARGHWVAVHRDMGALTAPVALLLLFSGWPMALPDVAKPAMTAVLGEMEPRPNPVAGEGDVDWAAAVPAAQARFENAAPRMAVWPASGKPASVRLRQPAEWHANGRTQVWIDPADGAVLATWNAQAERRAGRVYNVLWPLHAAKVGGLMWKLLAFAGGLGLAALSLYGAESFRRRLARLRRTRAPRPALAPAE
jgi:uncharacterized iron-regulated membrane protein